MAKAAHQKAGDGGLPHAITTRLQQGTVHSKVWATLVYRTLSTVRCTTRDDLLIQALIEKGDFAQAASQLSQQVKYSQELYGKLQYSSRSRYSTVKSCMVNYNTALAAGKVQSRAVW